MAKTIEQIQEEVQQIKNETVAKQNTATRVGGALEDMVEKMEADSIEVEGKFNNLGSKVSEFEKKTSNVNTEASGSDSIVIKTDDGVKVGQIDKNGADFFNLKSNGKDVLTEHQDISGKQDTILAGRNISIDEDGKTINAEGGVGDLPIIEEETAEKIEDSVSFADKDGKTILKITPNGVSAENLTDMAGNPIGGFPTTRGKSRERNIEITDDSGDVVVEIDQEGIKAKSVRRLNGDDLNDATSVTLELQKKGIVSATRKEYLQILVMTDTHADTNAVRRNIEYAERYSTIDAMVHLGDIVGGNFTETSAKQNWLECFTSANIPIFIAIGNHDVGNSTNPAICATHTQAYETWIKPMVDKGLLSEEEHSGENCYYYHDFEKYKIRIIVAYEYDDSLETDASGNYKIQRGVRVIRQEQASWFVNTLLNTPADYSVIVAMHNPYAKQIETKTSYRFCTDIEYTEGKGQIRTQGEFFADVVDCFQNKKTCNYDDGQIVVNADFSNIEAQFLCFIGGHVHRDLVWKHKTYNQYCVTPRCVTTSLPQLSTNDIYTDTNKPDSTTVLTFDTDNRVVRMAKIGVTQTIDCRKRDIESIKL